MPGNRPSKNKSGIETVQVQTEIRDIKAPCDENQSEMLEKPYKCVTCGKRYSRQKNNFSYSQSPLYSGNNHFLPTCCSCIENLVEQYTLILGNQDDAIKRICLHYDIYLSESMLNSARKIDADRSRIKNYIKQCNLTQNAGKTYDTYLNETKNNTVKSFEELEKIKSEKNSEKFEENIRKWGLGYSEIEYSMLDEHYRMLSEKIGNDEVRESLICDLCEQYILKYRARNEGDYDRYEKMTKLYQQTLSAADLKPRNTEKNLSGNPDECWGNWIKIVENYAPAEFFKDKEIFRDANGMDDYFRRFILRSTQNLMNGTSDKDEEFSIKDDDNDQP